MGISHYSQPYTRDAPFLLLTGISVEFHGAIVAGGAGIIFMNYGYHSILIDIKSSLYGVEVTGWTTVEL